ncbi:hypothetical protein Q0Z83_071230 [Actinoplanes sichuanensis]|uniref:Uncharacterized protein n=1 Tax=Actinoplanes sichuanensis TaxID=512349 RepID=A0ABW4AC18_9ACTN|nr:hypothetical protein [Actinoplanes sichuanensis]BEL08932.1 hypothetical protein Q0Z83_071230 [Actinoplanes sichuanensis]
MNNLQDGLARIAGPVAEPTREQVAADLARGQKALRRRRTTQVVGSCAFAVAALAAVIVGTTGTGAAPTSPEAAVDRPTAGAPQTAVTKLVAYQGEQPKGFTLDKVPDGWELQGADDYGIVIAPKGFKDKDPNSFVGKIVAQLQEFAPTEELKGKEVTVNGSTGLLTKMIDQTDGSALFVKLGEGRWMVIQVWDGLGWGEKEVLEFASGIHVDENAKITHG